MKSKRKKEYAGPHWLTLEKRLKLECCDCGLVHVFEIRVYKGVPQFRMSRDNRATGQIRRYKKVKP